MNQLKIEMNDCFGIHQFSQEFEFASDQNTILIYAPNGTMKTSFAKALKCKSEVDRGLELKDRIHSDRTATCSVLADGVEVEARDIFVIDAEDLEYDSSKYCTTFLASQALKTRYDGISRNQEGTLLKKCKDASLVLDYSVLERVNMMTPENIHLNSFMYEPLVDMSMTHLVQLYNDCKGLH